jgi:hypothetical protein
MLVKWFPNSPRSAELNVLVSIIGPSIVCGGYLIMALTASRGNIIFIVAMLGLAATTFSLAIKGCKKILQLIPERDSSTP